MVDKIRELCKKNGTSIFKLEKQLGFGNGVIGRWDKAVPNYERLSAVASALGMTVAELTGEADEKGIKKATALITVPRLTNYAQKSFRLSMAFLLIRWRLWLRRLM